MDNATTPPAPCAANGFLADHVDLLMRSLRQLTGRELLGGTGDPVERARQLWEAPFFVASHDTSPDPRLTYGNRCALGLFEMRWGDFVGTPSRFTAEEPERGERDRLLARVGADGYIDDYSGIRISSSGARFQIRGATVWNLSGEDGEIAGQAATFSEWTPV